MAQSGARIRRVWVIAMPLMWWAFVFSMHVITVDPDHVRRIQIPHLDKVVHGFLFMVLAFLTLRSISFFVARQSIHFAAVGALCMAYGALLEFVQSALFDYRMGDVADWLADCGGALLGLWLAGKPFALVFFGHQVGETH